MRKSKSFFLKSLVLMLAASLLIACGGKEERKAKYLERGKAYFEEQNFDKARVEFKNVLQIDPKTAERLDVCDSDESNADHSGRDSTQTHHGSPLTATTRFVCTSRTAQSRWPRTASAERPGRHPGR